GVGRGERGRRRLTGSFPAGIGNGPRRQRRRAVVGCRTTQHCRAGRPAARRRTDRTRREHDDGELDMTTRARKSGGRVSFVGTGTGDAGLLTVRAAEVLAGADIAFVDDSVSEAVRAVIGGEIRSDDPVARVVSGDPFGSEAVVREALAVAKTVIPFEVVPGLAEAVATATYAGVP